MKLKGALEMSSLSLLLDGKQLLYVSANWDLSIPETVEHVMKIVDEKVRDAMMNYNGETVIEIRMNVTGRPSSEDSAR